MRPIEEGCLAIVIGSIIPENNGLCVSVGKYLGDINHIREERLWEVDRYLIYRVLHQGNPIGFDKQNFCPEKNLMRIDDPDMQEDKKESKKVLDLEETEA